MKPRRKTIPIQILALVSVSRNACVSPTADKSTAPISVMPRFIVRSPILAHTTSASTIISVLSRSFRSLAIMKDLLLCGYDAGLFQKLSNGAADDSLRLLHKRIVAEHLHSH